MIKAILFDFDGVLTCDKTGSATTARYLSEQTGLPTDLVQSVFRKCYFGTLRGEATQREVWSTFCAETGVPSEPYLLDEAARATPMDGAMLDLVRGLRSEGYKTGIVTDNPSERMAVAAEYFGLNRLFDAITVSGEIGSRKNEPMIFEAAFAALGVHPEECVFIDNTVSNLTVPGQMGVKTIFFDDGIRDMTVLRNALNVILHA